MGGGAKLLHEEPKGHPFEVTNKLLRLAHSQAECLHKRRVVQGCALLLGGFLRRLASLAAASTRSIGGEMTEL